MGEPGGAAGLVGGDGGVVPEGDADVVEAFEQAVVVEVLELERLVEVDGGDRDAAVDDVDDDLDASGRPRSSRMIRVTTSAGSATGSSPIFRQLLRKMSANRGEITARNP